MIFALLLFWGVSAEPVLRVDVPSPTADKPQSKLWFAQGSWWAWLPVKGGSSVWRRGATGWSREAELDGALRGLPGQADVWADAASACAVLVEERRLAVTCLEWAGTGYRPRGKPVEIGMTGEGKLETATITRDAKGEWWIGYGWGREMFVRRSGDGWAVAVKVSETLASADDICAVVAVSGGVGMIWSDQAADVVWFRWHGKEWGKVEAIERGGKTADDHIRAAVGADGRLHVVMKNSRDAVGEPQLVMRVRDKAGRWRNRHFAPRTKEYEPSRPLVLLGGRPEREFVVYSRYARTGPTPRGSQIVTGAAVLLEAARPLNDVTGTKALLPPGQPWIVLASDKDGNVYEGRLDAGVP